MRRQRGKGLYLGKYIHDGMFYTIVICFFFESEREREGEGKHILAWHAKTVFVPRIQVKLTIAARSWEMIDGVLGVFYGNFLGMLLHCIE